MLTKAVIMNTKNQSWCRVEEMGDLCTLSMGKVTTAAILEISLEGP